MDFFVFTFLFVFKNKYLVSGQIRLHKCGYQTDSQVGRDVYGGDGYGLSIILIAKRKEGVCTD